MNVLTAEAALPVSKVVDESSFSLAPTTNKGKKWRIAYYEGGPYTDYQQVFTETVRGLMQLGWIEIAELPKQTGEENIILWNWLATKAKSKYLEFPKDAYYTGNWISKQRAESVTRLMKRLTQTKDIDLLIAVGTQAGQDFANDKHRTPTLVLTASDPVSAGIIKSIEDSGFEHVHATIDPKRYERQIRVFHEIINFNKLGMIYEDSINGRSFSAIDQVEKIANERNFEIVKCFSFDESIDDQEAREKSVIKCFNDLASKVDAIYITQQSGVNSNTIPKMVEIANQHHIPTFSQAGSAEVKWGFLLSLSQAGFRYVGEFQAKVIAKVLNGAKPNQLSQLFEEPPKIAINLRTAEIIGFDPPIVMLGAADEIFNTIESP
ncbi:MAG: ABC transporter substrate-binding protein [Gammaproteobacteria bacterium]|nr:ABC transporter substrate-binding protein [Gammaproteobacteria bacterium]